MRRSFTNSCLLVGLLAVISFFAHSQTLPLSIGHTYAQATNDVTVAANGDVYVLSHASVQIFRNGTFLRAFDVYPEFWGNDPGLTAIDIGPDGRVYVMDVSNYNARIFDADGNYIRYLGSYNSRSTPVAGGFGRPFGVAIRSNGDIYISDSYTASVQVFDSQYNFKRIIYWMGSESLGRPMGMAFDADNNLYVVDYEGKRIIVLDANESFVRAISVTTDQWMQIQDVTLDGDNNIYVSEYGLNEANENVARIKVFSNTGTLLRTIGSYGNNDNQLMRPKGIKFSDGKLYVSDSWEGKVVSFDATTGNYLSKLGGGSDAPGKFSNFTHNAPYGSVAIDSRGNMFAIDYRKNYVQVFTESGSFVKTIGVPGTGAGQFQDMNAIAIDAADNIYVLDNGGLRIQIFNSSGVYQRSFNPTKRAVSLSVGISNRIYTVNSQHNLIQRYSNDGVFELQFSISNGTRQLALDDQENIYVCEESSFGINVYSSDGIWQRKFGERGGQEGKFYGGLLALDDNKNIFLFDYDGHISIFNNDGAFIKRHLAFGEIKTPAFIGQLGVAVVGALGNGKIIVHDLSRLQVFAMPTNTLSFDELPEKTFGDEPFTLSATSDFPVQYTSSNTSVATITDNTVTIKAAGVTNITARQITSGGWSAETITRTLTVNKAPQVITFEPLEPVSIADEMVKLNFTSTSTRPMGITSSDPEIASISGSWVVFHKAGNVTITITQPGNANYADAEPIARELQINKVSQSLTFESLPEKVVDAEPFELVATSSSNEPIIFESSDPSVASIEDNIVTILKAGTIEITARQLETDYYSEASVSQVLTVSKKSQTIAFGLPAVKVVSAPPFEVNATSTSGLPITYETSNPLIASISGNTITLHGEGVVTITASQSGDDIWAAATPVSRQLAVTAKQLQTISFEVLPEKIYGDQPFMLTASSSSGLPITYLSSDPSIASIQGDVVTIHKAGQVIVTAQQPGNDEYFVATDVMQPLVINKATQSITFPALEAKTISAPVFALSATASSDLPVHYTSSNALVATVNDGVVTIVGVGSTTIRATQPGNENYHPAMHVDQELTVTKDTQIITFDPLQERILGEEPFTLSASVSSELELTFTSSNTAVATINGNVVTLRGAGTTVIRAIQPGNDQFLPAMVEQTLTVKLVTNIEEKHERHVSVYPNPVSDVLMISVSKLEGAVQVVDVKGTVTNLFATPTKDGFEVDIRNLENGIYTVIVFSSGKILTARIVKI